MIRRAFAPLSQPTAASQTARQISNRRSGGFATPVGGAFSPFFPVATAHPALAGSEISKQGHRPGTKGRLARSSLDGAPLDFSDRASQRTPGRTPPPNARRLGAAPTEGFSGGFVGYPGCKAILDAIGVWGGVEEGRSPERQA